MSGHARLPVLGIDIGGVLVDRVAEGDDTSFFGNRPMDTPAVPGSREAVAHLVELFEHRVHIVSKAGSTIAGLSRKWLAVQGLVGAHAIDPANLHFVRKRPDKHPICQRLAITHFVDDRVDVLDHLVTVDHKVLFTGGLGVHEPPASVSAGIVVAESWPAAITLIAATLSTP